MPLPEPPPLGASALPHGSFERETVVVTGGGTGLGKAIAVEFARLGAKLAIVSRREEHRAAGVAAVEALGREGDRRRLRHPRPRRRWPQRSTRSRRSSGRPACS